MRFQSLQKVALALSQEHSIEVLLSRIVAELAGYRGVALARLWLFERGQDCQICRSKPESLDHSSSLHLCASAGLTLKGQHVTGLGGEFHHGGIKVRQINERGKPILIKEVHDDEKWTERPEWARQERIRSFAGHPLIFAGKQVGVIALFARFKIEENDFEWLRIFSVAIAGNIVSARAFDEIDQLRRRLESENAYLRVEVGERASSTEILGSSAGTRRVLDQIEMVATTDATVLVLGETGVGKELVARSIHERSSRRDNPLVKVNCTAIPPELFESEFFGHVKGAFSGALRDRMGRFQMAEGGTLFLDEVGNLPDDMQPKLLRVLQDGEFQPVGEDRPRHADVRVVAASNHNLKQAVHDGTFREDLYYRLSVFPIEVPPLHERTDDIPILAKYFIEAACRRFNRTVLPLSSEHVRQLQKYDWPGNVRELQNVLERAVITARSGTIHLDIEESAPTSSVVLDDGSAPGPVTILTEDEMKRRDRENIIAALRQSAGKIYGPHGAAELLGMKPTTLNARIKKLGLRKLA